MKVKILIFSILLFSFCVGQGQPYLTLPDSNAIWTYTSRTINPVLYTDSISVTKDDTLINSKYYVKLFLKKDTLPAVYNGCFRSDTSGQTWYIDRDSVNEYLLIDLSKNIGDTIYNLLSEDRVNLVTAVVDTTIYNVIGPSVRKSLYLHDPNCVVKRQWEWHEIVGCSSGFFNRNCSANPWEDLYCMRYNGIVYYHLNVPVFWGGPCWTVVGLNESIPYQWNWNIYPNPFSSHATLQLEHYIKAATLSLYNSYGQIVRMLHNLSGKTIKLQRDNLPSGLYFIQLTQDGRIVASSKVVIQ